jgi:hypothetical protein
MSSTTPKKSSKQKEKKGTKCKKPAVFRRACFADVEPPDGFEPCYVCIGGRFVGLGVVYAAMAGFYSTVDAPFPLAYAIVPFCVVNRFGMAVSTCSFKQKLVVRGKSYDCPVVWVFGNQREPYHASVSQCDCELMGDQFEKRWVVSLVRNTDFVPAKPTGLEGICQL